VPFTYEPHDYVWERRSEVLLQASATVVGVFLPLTAVVFYLALSVFSVVDPRRRVRVRARRPAGMNALVHVGEHHVFGHPARARTSRRPAAQIAGSPQQRGVQDQMLAEPGNPVHSGQATLAAATQAADVTLVLFRSITVSPSHCARSPHGVGGGASSARG
jgi:hypothetical protein